MRKSVPFAAMAVLLLGVIGNAASAQDLEAVHLDDAAWIKDAGDRLARCAGTYRGAAEVMRDSGNAQSATYADSVASGALFAAYLLLTSPAAVEAKVLDTVDTNVHIEALAWGAKRNFVLLAEGDPAMPDVLRSCTQTGSLQSSVLSVLTASAALSGTETASAPSSPN